MLIAGVSLSTPPAFAEAPRATLELEAGPCGQVDLRAKVAARLGFDPFVGERGDIAIRVAVLPANPGLAAVITTADVAGGDPGERTVQSQHGDCDALFDAVALTIAVAIDPLQLHAPPKEQVPDDAASPPTEPEESDPTSLSWVVEVFGGASAAFGTTPSPTPSARLGVEIGDGTFSVGAEGRYDAPTSEPVGGTSAIEVALIAGAGFGCYRIAWGRGCVLVVGGAHRAQGENLANTEPVTTPFVAAGARTGAELQIYGPLAVRAEGELLIALTRTTLRIGNTAGWTSPDVAGGVGVSLVVRLH